MRVLFCASESAPFAKTGGLADVIGALPKALLKKEYAGNRWLRVECLLRALKHGMNGKYGKVIDPAEFAKRIR